ncbi:LuxR C-terminal-related transcriptional regulator [Nocardia sp. CNY236]|uniref:helix-turn-helix transcriptional regulator n=1 Tax=Nocardia sp. CNY236 TaxID=1169152 RepID=UPI0003FFE02B|nr:LuxR C-terminal-related transcriptional regulator [Nocardia sp. CNY236]
MNGPGDGGLVARKALVDRLQGSARVAVVSALAGSGKTVLLRSWVAQASLAGRTAWVTVAGDERDPQQFWLAVVDALKRTGPGSASVQAMSAAPDLDGWSMVERLLMDSASLEDLVWLVVDDVHELATEGLQQLELLIMRAPPHLRFVLASRHDVRLGLHRLRLEGNLSEIRTPDLRFGSAEARQLFAAAGVELPEASAQLVLERTEGWAAGLRLAALSLTGRPTPGQFAISGSERTVAEYLLTEVLDRQSIQVRRLLLRTSILERVNGALADLLSGGSGGERVLHDLEEKNAFVVSLDTQRSWFRYHTLFADLLRLELRRTWPDEITDLHRTAAEWFAEHGYPVQAIRHAQAAQNWDLASGLLADHWPGLHLDGRATTVHDLLGGFPIERIATDAELAAIAATDELSHGSVETANHYLSLAENAAASMPAHRAGQAPLLLGTARLLLARHRGDLDVVASEAKNLQDMTAIPDPMRFRVGRDLHALALISLGTAEHWATRFADAGAHLEQGRELAHRLGRPYLEFTGLAYQASAEVFQSFALATEHGRQAIDLAERHGWTDTSAAGMADIALGTIAVWQGKLDEAALWSQRAERTIRAEARPGVELAIHYLRGVLDLARGRNAAALASFRTGAQLADLLAAPNLSATTMRFFVSQALVRLGEIDDAEQALAAFHDDHDRGELRIATAVSRLATGDPHTVIAELAPVLDGCAPLLWRSWQIQAFWLEAIARDALDDPGAAGRALEHALDLAELDGVLLWFLLHPAPDLLERHAGRSAHAALIAEIQSLLAAGQLATPVAGPPPAESLSASELRVLRYLPTNLTAPEIARELSVSHNTIRTHMRNLYAKLGTHRRSETVTRARGLGLLAPSASRSGR